MDSSTYKLEEPCIVISCDKANGKSPVYTVIPGTTKMKRIIFQYI